MQDREHESRGFAGTGLRLAYDVVPFKQKRDRL